MRLSRRGLVVALFWGALLFCLVALAKQRETAVRFIEVLGGIALAPLLIGLILMWMATVASWQRMLQAWGAGRVDFHVAARHLALLLIGKYLPGGFWGFVSRHLDRADGSSGRCVLLAGLSEQGVGLTLLVGLGGSALLLPMFGPMAAIGAAFTTLVFCIACVVAADRMLRGLGNWQLLKRFSDAEASVSAVGAARAVTLTLVQHVIFIVLVAGIAWSAFDLTLVSAALVGGAYGLSVGLGMAALFVPAGIVVREGAFIALLGHYGVLSSDDSFALAAFLRLISSGYDFATVGLAWVSARIASRRLP